MRQIREIKKLTGGRYLVCLEEGVSFSLYGKELTAFGIEEDGVLPEEAYEQIRTEILTKRARLCTLNALERMDRTENQLRGRLNRQYYPEEIVDDAIAYAKSYHYIDDLRYAKNYIESRGSQKSLRRIEQELLARGISRDIFREALETSGCPDEDAQIDLLLRKKHYDPQTCTKEELSRLYAFLMRRGYSSEAVRRSLQTARQRLPGSGICPDA